MILMKPIFHGVLTTAAALCLAAMGLSACQQLPKSASLSGKILVLDYPSRTQQFIFPDSDKVSHDVRSLRKAAEVSESDMVYPVRTTRISYSYSPEKKEFHEEFQVLYRNDSAVDGHGYSTWRLDYRTPEHGTATLIAKHPMALPQLKVGDSVPFQLKPCPQFSVRGDLAAENETWIKELLYEHLQNLPALQEANKVQLHQRDSMFAVLEISSGVGLFGGVSNFVVFVYSPWGTHKHCCTFQLDTSSVNNIQVDLGKDNQLQITYDSNTCVLPVRPLSASSEAKIGTTWRIVQGQAEKVEAKIVEDGDVLN